MESAGIILVLRAATPMARPIKGRSAYGPARGAPVLFRPGGFGFPPQTQ
jgi:hypothetical protein